MSPVGKVVILKGVARTQKGPLKIGDPIFPKDVISTEKNSAVKVLMTDRSIIDVTEQTVFRVDGYELKNVHDRKVDLSVDFGRIRSSVNKKLNQKGSFLIRTKSSVLAVRGTEFVVASKEIDGKMKDEITVFEGKVDVASHLATHPVSLLPGSQLSFETASGVETPRRSWDTFRVRELSTPQMDTVLGDTRIAEIPFSHLTSLDPSEQRPIELGSLLSSDNLSTVLASAARTTDSTASAPSDTGNVLQIRPDDLAIPGVSTPDTITSPNTGEPLPLPSSVKVRITIK